jgi:hypothetical protein
MPERGRRLVISSLPRSRFAPSWSLLVFLIGGVLCAINYVFLKDNSYFAEYMHSHSMATAFGLAAYALMEARPARSPF